MKKFQKGFEKLWKILGEDIEATKEYKLEGDLEGYLTKAINDQRILEEEQKRRILSMSYGSGKDFKVSEENSNTDRREPDGLDNIPRKEERYR